MEFHEEQLKAIRHKDGPMMVLAGPGSGKTTVITHRVKTLVEEYGIAPASILVITFTRAAAREMRERYEKLTGRPAGAITFGTFHSVFFTILRHAYNYDASCILRDDERDAIMRELTERYEVETDDIPEFISMVLQEISAVKGEMLDLDCYYAKSCSDELFKKLYRGYENALRQKNRIDFDDMLTMCYDLFVQRPDILALWQQKYRYILVDEFQDINHVQYEIVRMLAAPENNLFIVGDDDQSIYRYRGARPEIMLGFPKDYPDAVQAMLGINYRCTQPIVEAAGKLIAHNKARFPKEITSSRGAGRPVAAIAYEDPAKEARAITQDILDYKKMGYDYGDIAVLYRTNRQPRLLSERLMEYNIPFQIRDSIPNLYDHWIAQDILSYINAAAAIQKTGRCARADAIRIANRPNRYISREAFADPQVSWARVKAYYRGKSWMMERIDTLESDLRMIASLSPAAAVNYIRKGVGYDEYLKEHAKERRLNPEDLIETADQVQEGASGYRTVEEWEVKRKEYTEKLKEVDTQRRARPDGVVLMTMHSAKGLEFPIVYILDVNETITPYHKAVLEPDIEEERRMFYVAMTRAKDRLTICYVNNRYGKPQAPSRFIDECKN